MAQSPLVQATQESIESLYATSARWGRLFEAAASQRTQLDAQADVIAAVFLAFSVAFGSLPRFRTEPGLRRFMEAMQELQRALKAMRAPALATTLEELVATASQGSRQAEAAFAAVSGKPVESHEPAAVVPAVRGSVFKVLSDRGYGFVRPTGETTEIFFTAQSVLGAKFGELRVGQNVSFRVIPDPRVPGRMQAVEVQPSR